MNMMEHFWQRANILNEIILSDAHTQLFSINVESDWRFTVWQISGVSSDLRRALGANKLFWKLNIITMLMLLLINQAGNWPRIIRPQRLLIGHQVTTPASYWSVGAVADLRDSNDSWEVGHKLKFVANICVKGVKINYCDLCVLCCLISPWGTKQVQIASRQPVCHSYEHCSEIEFKCSHSAASTGQCRLTWPILTAIMAIIRTWFQSPALKLFLLCGEINTI